LAAMVVLDFAVFFLLWDGEEFGLI
jgi:hypothetical protein